MRPTDIRVALALCAIIGLITCSSVVGVCATSTTDAEAAYLAADNLAAAGQLSAAVSAWQKIMADFGDQPKVCASAKLAMGDAYVALGQTENAQQQFNDLIAAYPGYRQSADASLNLGRILEGKNEFSQALAVYSNIADNYSIRIPQCAESKLRMAACHAGLGQADKQLEDLSAVLLSYPDEREKCAEARIRIGQINKAAGRVGDAMAQFEFVNSNHLELGLWRADALLWLAETQRQAGLTEEALDSYAQVISGYQAAAPQRLKAMLGRGAVFEQLGRHGEAIKEYGAALLTYPQYRRQTDAAMARVAALLPFADISENTASESRNVLANYEVFKLDSPLDNAYQDLAEKAGVAPAYPRLRKERVESLMRAGWALRALGQCSEAEAKFQEILARCDDTETWRAQAKLDIGQTQWKAGKMTEALATLEDLIETLPALTSECKEAMFTRGQIYEQLKDYDSAVTEYRRIGATYPGSVVLRFRATEACAQVLLAQGKPEEALAEVDGLVSRYPVGSYSYKRAVLAKGLVQFRVRKLDECAALLGQLLADYPDMATTGREARMLLVQALLEANKCGEALPILNGMLADTAWSADEKALITGYIERCSEGA